MERQTIRRNGGKAIKRIRNILVVPLPKLGVPPPPKRPPPVLVLPVPKPLVAFPVVLPKAVVQSLSGKASKQETGLKES